MAFPTIPTVAAGRVVTGVQANTTATRTFPSLSGLTKNSGDLLIAFIVCYQSSLTSNIFSSWGAGFTELKDIGVASQHCIGVAYKFSTGSETGTFTVAQAGTVTGHAAFVLLSIPGAHASAAPEILAALATGTSTAADPAALTPSWGADDTLWICLAGCGETGTGGAFQGLAGAGGGNPTNYGNNAPTGISADAVGGIEGGAYFRQLNTASENVGPISPDTSNARNCATVLAVRPVAVEAHSGSLVATGGGVVASVLRKGAKRAAAVATGGGVVVEIETTNHNGIAVNTGSGVGVFVESTARLGLVVATGGGVEATGQSTDRLVDLTATGGGILTWDYEVGAASEEHSGDFAATGGGVALVAGDTQRTSAQSFTGAGIGSIADTTHRDGELAGTGGGVLTAELVAGLVGDLQATGAGTIAVDSTTDRTEPLAGSGAGVAVYDLTTDRSGSLAATGGGIITWQAHGEGADFTGDFSATGGGVVSVSLTSARHGAALLSGGGVLQTAADGQHTANLHGSASGSFGAVVLSRRYGGFAAVGSGSTSFNAGPTPSGLPDSLTATIHGLGTTGAISAMGMQASIQPIDTLTAEIS